MTADIDRSPSTFFIPDDDSVTAPSGLRVMRPEALLALLAAEQRDLVREVLAARESSQALVLLQTGGLALLCVEPCTDGMRLQLQSLEEVIVPGEVAEAVLGARRQDLHDLSNNLAAARLNGELVQRLLAQQKLELDADLTEALTTLVRLNALVEEQVRELQARLVLPLSGRQQS